MIYDISHGYYKSCADAKTTRGKINSINLSLDFCLQLSFHKLPVGVLVENCKLLVNYLRPRET